ncbi:MAG: pyridine nucleotide-disulfide oxidoreductase, partial [Myxococcota bacterium]
QPPSSAEVVLWALGRAQPNSGFLPSHVVDRDGFVPVEPTLQLADYPEVFCVGDLAATDPFRSSARNGGAEIVAKNVTRLLKGERRALAVFSAPSKKWGEIITSTQSGMLLFTPGGRRVRLPNWLVQSLIFDLILFRVIYRGVNRAQGDEQR